MKVANFIFPIWVAAAGCSTFDNRFLAKDISLSTVEQLDMGKTSSSVLEASFGKPGRIVPLSAREEIWVYLESRFETPVQKASFVIDKATHLILTATWIPGVGDSLQNRQKALEHFKDASFIAKDVGLVAGHEYSSDVTYADAHSGVSLRTNSVNQTVSAISFGIKSANSVAHQP